MRHCDHLINEIDRQSKFLSENIVEEAAHYILAALFSQANLLIFHPLSIILPVHFI